MLTGQHNHFTGVAQRKRARLITLRTPDRNGSPVLLQFTSFTEATRLASDVKCSQNTLYRDGAGEARGAHNPEVTGSNPVPGILQFGCFTEATRHSSRDVKHEHPFTGMAQGQRAGLITLRSQDQNLLPVFYTLHVL